MEDSAFFTAFRSGFVGPQEFDHRAHLRAAWCAPRQLPFLEACIVMRNGIGRVARKADKVGLYPETITIALMALIAERIDGCTSRDAAEFLYRHADLFDPFLLADFDRPRTPASDAARRRFVLCDGGAGRLAA